MGFDAKNPGSGKTSSVLTVTAFPAKIKLLVRHSCSNFLVPCDTFSFSIVPFRASHDGLETEGIIGGGHNPQTTPEADCPGQFR